MSSFLGFGRKSDTGQQPQTPRFIPVTTADTPCVCGHPNRSHGYVDGFWDNTPDVAPCGDCDCKDFTPPSASEDA